MCVESAVTSCECPDVNKKYVGEMKFTNHDRVGSRVDYMWPLHILTCSPHENCLAQANTCEHKP